MLKALTRPLLAFAALTALASPASAAWAPLTGQYSTTGHKVPGVTLMLEQSGSQVRGSVSIVADQLGQRVVASDFTGYTSRGVLRFDWADTYGSTGRGTFQRVGKSWLLVSRIVRRAGEGPYFEGRFMLTKSSGGN